MKEPKQSSHKKGKNTSNRLVGPLSFRVFSLNALLIITPLVVYLALIFHKTYNEKLYAVYAELTMIQKDEVDSINALEANTQNFLRLLQKIVPLFEKNVAFSDKELRGIIQDYITRGSLSAAFYLEVREGNKLICTDSTLDKYIGLDLTPRFARYFREGPRDDICVCKDPIFGYCLYINDPIYNDKKELVGILTGAISLSLLIEQLHKISSFYDTDLTILNERYQVIASNNLEFIDYQFGFQQAGKEERHQITFKRTNVFQQGYNFLFRGETHFGVLTHLPETDMFLLLSLPAQVLLTQMYAEIALLVAYLLWILLIGGSLTLLLTWRMSKPLKHLGLVMEKVGEGDLEETFEKDFLGFEINRLGMQFNQMVASLKEHIEEVQKEKAHTEAYAKELQIGHEIQRSILPTEEEMFPGLFLHRYFKPAKEVAGDFYDWLIQKNRVLITIADGVGKGVSSCLYSFDLRSILRSYATVESDLKSIIEKTNRLFCEDTKESGNFVTAFILEYNHDTKTFLYANCGHNPPLIKRKDGTIEKLEGGGMAFGVMREARFEVKSMTLNEGDFLILYTDGVNEAQNPFGQILGMERFSQILKFSPAVTTDCLVKDIVESVDAHTKGALQYDDITLIVLKLAHQ